MPMLEKFDICCSQLTIGQLRMVYNSLFFKNIQIICNDLEKYSGVPSGRTPGALYPILYGAHTCVASL